jgi:predicted cupin superfamily sugar epimerase/chorismate-pyruvate lyase
VRFARGFCFALLLAAAGAPAGAGDLPPTGGAAWPDTFVARVELLALLQSLNAELLSHDSATRTLERWCEARQLASPAVVVADRIRDDATPASDAQRGELAVGPGDDVRHRRVRLRCGSTLLSEADNWYVPARLSAAMNAQLDATDTPFGRVVQALRFQRRTLASTLLWSPLAEDWASSPPSADRASEVIQMPSDLLRHRALLTLPDGTPFSEVVETYKSSLLGAPPPPAPQPAGLAERLIAHYAMQKVPQEGVWFAPAYRSRDRLTGRALPARYRGIAHAAGSSIIALATPADFSALHRLRSDETWHFYGGAPLDLLMLYPDGRGRRVTLGPDLSAGESFQVTVPRGVWMGAAPRDSAPSAYSLFGTQLTPAFDYADFEAGYRDELERRYPAFAPDIERLTRAEFAVAPPVR